MIHTPASQDARSILFSGPRGSQEARPIHGRVWRALRTVLAWSAVASILALGCSRPSLPLTDPPNPPVAGLDPALAGLLQAKRAEVLTDPASAQAWGALGQAFDAADYAAEARLCYRRAGELDGAEPRWPHLLGLRLLQDDFEQAVGQLDRAVRLAGTNHDAPRLRLAQALIERGRLVEATNHLRALLILRPGHPAARLELARVGLIDGDLVEVASILKPCLTNPYTARAAGLLLSQVRARQGQTELAVELARRAGGLPKPFDWPDLFTQEVQALRSDRQRLAEKAATLIAQRRFDEARVVLRTLLERNPDDSEALLLSGRLSLDQRRCAEAEQKFRAHLALVPESLNGNIQLGLALLCQQRWVEAIPVLETVVRLKPDFAQGHANLAVAHSRAGNGEAAILDYEEALRCSPGDAAYHVSLAEELLRARRRNEAKAHLDRALEIDTQHSRARALLESWGRVEPLPRGGGAD